MTSTPAHCSYQGCTRPVHSGTGLCIFHAPADKKAPQEFRNALAAQIRTWRNEKATMWDFRGWVLVDVDRRPRSMDSGRKFNLFRRAIFPAEVDFWAAQFACSTSFVRARFMRYAQFAAVEFARDVSFEDSTFTVEAGFIGTTFAASVSFESATFLALADFDATVLTRHANFACVAFARGAYFGSAIFSSDATFMKAAFGGYTSFESTEFKGSVSYESVVFAKEVSFESVDFLGDAIFDGVYFRSKSSFISVWFRARADFDKVVFDDMDLSYAVFAVEGHIGVGTLDKRAILRWPGPGKRYDEEGKAVVRGTLRLRAAEFASKRGFLDLRGNILNDDTTLILEECDMSRILLGRLDWARLRIVAPKWKCLGGRKTVGDEYVPRKLFRWPVIQDLLQRKKSSKGSGESDTDMRLDPTSVADTYLLLTKRFREDLKHAWANDFNCGAFAMNRLAPPDQSCIGQRLCSMLRKETRIAPLWWLKRAVYILLLLFKRYFSLTALYGLTAGYGRSILRPVFSLVFINAAAGLWYKLLGGWSIVNIWGQDGGFGHICRELMEAVADGCTIVTFKHTPADLVGPSRYASATIIRVVQIILTAIMAALTLFAVRRRFRHG
jgi:hypothetical protein